MIEVLDLRNVNWGSAGTIKACFSIKFTILLPNNQSSTMLVKDMKLIEGQNGLFVGSPQVAYELNGEKKYKSIVDISRDLQDKLVEAVSNAYDDTQELNVVYTAKSWVPKEKVDETEKIPF
jgi:DNA-binding cell septation regulator SpoVG